MLPTTAGIARAVSLSHQGLDLQITHIQIGTGHKAPDGTETALQTPAMVTTISGGGKVGTSQLRLTGVFASVSNIDVSEIGYWSGDPALSTSTLCYYWSQASGVLVSISSGVDFVLSHDMAINAGMPNITIVVDSGNSASAGLVFGHEAKTNPHPQYLTEAQAQALIEARVGDYVIGAGTANAITCALNPVVTSYTSQTTFAVKALATNTGAVTVNAGGGAKPLLRDDGTAMQAGDIQAGMVVTVVFDTATDSFYATDMVVSQTVSQAGAIADAAVAAHEAKTDPHAQYMTQAEVDAKFLAVRGLRYFHSGF